MTSKEPRGSGSASGLGGFHTTYWGVVLAAGALETALAGRLQRQEPVTPHPPESLYDRRWAVTLLDRAMERPGADHAAAGQRALFDPFKGLLLTEGSGEVYRGKALESGLGEGAVKVAVHRLRQRFGEAVRAETAQTVATPAEVEEELRSLLAAMSG